MRKLSVQRPGISILHQNSKPCPNGHSYHPQIYRLSLQLCALIDTHPSSTIPFISLPLFFHLLGVDFGFNVDAVDLEALAMMLADLEVVDKPSASFLPPVLAFPPLVLPSVLLFLVLSYDLPLQM